MGTLKVRSRAGSEKLIEGRDGLSVMELIRGSGDEEIQALCGGCCSCATCHVYVDSNFWGLLPPMNDDENELLEVSSHRHAQSRLSCQIIFGAALDGLRVTVAPED
ncbi:2Fe-2S iron-sulfur cluster binding domain-containing protein [Paraburkholderia sediminicola]|nr:2Fe-2S iron-sulfur cluster binding domain-containing protein [Paraburkholderia sediminicola]